MNYFSLHVLSKSPWSDWILSLLFLCLLLNSMIVLLKLVEEVIIKNSGLIPRHGIVKIRLGTFDLVVKCELGNQHYLVVHVCD